MTNQRRLSALLSTILSLALVPTITAAQGPPAITDLRLANSGSVEGTVKDSSSAMIPGVKVTLTNNQTGVVDTKQTNDAGKYDFNSVPPGTYTLRADLSGFSPDLQENIRVGTSSQIRLDLVLRVGGAARQTKMTEEDVRLIWTASPGTGNSYVIERSGPGLTLFTLVAGPISETSYVVDTKGRDFDGGVTYHYRVRAIDSAQNKGAPSNSVSVRSTRIPDLPIGGTNVLDLISALPGFANNGQSLRPDDTPSRSFTLETTGPDSISLFFTGVSRRNLSFMMADGSQTFSWGCPDCSFVVGPGGVGPVVETSRGAIFKLSADGSKIEITCRAVKCEVITARQIETENGILHASGNVVQQNLAMNDKATIPATQRTFLSVNNR